MEKRNLIIKALLMLAISGIAAAWQNAPLGGDGLPLFSYTVQDLNVVNPDTGKTLRGTLYLPRRKGRIPLAVTAHELGSNVQRRWPAYGQSLASHGVAVYAFDFAGGGPKMRADGAPGNRSDGETVEMSVLTEVRDLEAVLSEARKWDFVDAGKIVIIGGSQGGAAAIVAAGRRSKEVSGLVLLYPAQYMIERLVGGYKGEEDFPESLVMWGMVELGRKYFSDLWKFGFGQSIAAWTKPVLILHGDADAIVPFSDSQALSAAYKDARLERIAGGAHGFQGEAFDEAMVHINGYLRQIGVMK